MSEISESKDLVHITEEKINYEALTQYATVPEAGAISSFIGTTRNNFNGKKVLKLEYEAYTPMALKELQKLCDQVRQKWEVLKIAVVHRIGEVPIGEASVIIVVSSAHRRESLEAVHWAIDELKATVPIWKKEFYEDGETSWKKNSECCFTKHNEHQHHH